MSDEIRNAVINDATIEISDHGILTSWLALDYGGLSQGFGGRVLLKRGSGDTRNYAGWWLLRVLEVAGVRNWDALVGKTIRVRRRDDLVVAIGHIVKDDWFSPEADWGS